MCSNNGLSLLPNVQHVSRKSALLVSSNTTYMKYSAHGKTLFLQQYIQMRSYSNFIFFSYLNWHNLHQNGKVGEMITSTYGVIQVSFNSNASFTRPNARTRAVRQIKDNWLWSTIWVIMKRSFITVLKFKGHIFHFMSLDISLNYVLLCLCIYQ